MGPNDSAAQPTAGRSSRGGFREILQAVHDGCGGGPAGCGGTIEGAQVDGQGFVGLASRA